MTLQNVRWSYYKIIDHISWQYSMCGSERPNKRRDPPDFLCLFLFFRQADLAWGWLKEDDWVKVYLRVTRRCAHDRWQVYQICLPKVLRCWWLHKNQILCSKVYDKFPTKVQDYRHPPNFSNYANILDSLKMITKPMKWLFLEVHQLYLNVQDSPYTAPSQRL